ncbi:hypothetical protein [Cellulomonas oligotrophica]|uniref:BioF2-like acetyltransferase domain-containing protein n=1 Tax=Cellulomonas oligotrophica TaxID=931536 RepID=A0A7Y9FHQ4_9CELL|nr:hypothetical protein [Cellulomonas oligotrophica]NYD87403.1 hypothetical protein [Cellulomonas oligotrophica]GIG34119.1 hypothetical protein Col01nite_32780 [Cellulomonas oligotrophica]
MTTDAISPLVTGGADPLRSPAYLDFAARHLAGRVRVHRCAAPNDGLAVAHEYPDRIPLTFDLAAHVRAVGVDASGLGARWLVLSTPLRFRPTLFGADGAAALAGLIDRARADGLDGVVMPWVPNDDHQLSSILRDQGFIESFYDADWSVRTADHESLDSLLDAMPRGPRKRFVNDRNHFVAHGCTVRGWSADDAADVARMHREFMTDQGHPGPELADTAAAAFAGLPGGRVDIAVDAQGRRLAFVMSLFGDDSHVLRWGRHRTSDDARVYANLGYLHPLELAVRTGAQRVWFGKSAHRFKLLRGMTPTTASVFALGLSGHGRMRTALAAAGEAYRARFEELTTL